MKRIAFFASFVAAIFLLAGVSYFFISPGTKAAAVISNVTAINIMGPGAQITWSTDVPSDSRVAYGTASGFYSFFSNNRCDAGGYVTTHCVNLTGLSANTVYYYKVESRDLGGDDSQLMGFQFTSASGGGGDTIAPSIPAGLGAATVSSSQIGLSWTASTDNVGVVGYKIYRGGIQIGTATTPNYSDTGLAAATSYTYTVLAYDAAGNQSGQSSSVNGSTSAPVDTTAPTTPAGLTATAVSTSQINLAWTASTDNVGVTGYKIYKNGIYIGSVTTGTTYSSTGLSAGTSYSYTVAAFDSAGNVSGQSTAVNASTQISADTVAPNTPTGLSATAVSSTGINLAWTASTDNVGVVGYKIYRGGIQIGEASTPNYSDTGLAQGTSYSYTVLAYDAAGNQSGQSSQASAQTVSSSDVTAPTTPTGLTATAVSTSQINLAWTASTDNVGVTGYKIYKNGTYIGSVTTGTTYSSTELSAGTSYSYTVLALDAGGNFSGQSSPASAVTLSVMVAGPANTTDTTAPVISNVRVENIISSGAQIKWSTDDASDSLVQFGTISGSSASNSNWRCDEGGDVTAHCINLTGLVSGATYYYKAVSRNAAGLETKSLEKSFVAGSAGTATTTTTTTTTPTTTVVATTATTTVTTTATAPAVQENQRAYIALWQGDINVLSGQTIKGDIRVNVGVENAESVSIYRKKKDGTEPTLLGQAIRATDRSSLWRFVWNSKTVPDGDAVLFSRVKNATGEYAGDSVYVIVKNAAAENTSAIPATGTATATSPETATIVNELFAQPENLEVAKVYLSQQISKFLDGSSVEEKQRAAEKIRKELALDILVSDTGSVDVLVGTTTLSRRTEPELVVREIARAVKNRKGASVLEDTDKDTISDYDETYIYGTDPNKADTDGDGVNDGEEILLGMNPLKNEVALISYENPKEVTIAAKADVKDFTVNKVELVQKDPAQTESVSKQYVSLEGTALPNSFVMLYIFSTPVVVTVKTDSDGKWRYTMDKELEDGTHEVYVAMTESAGKIIVKSDPIPFVKTAQAVTLSSDFALANTAVESQTGFFRGGTLIISLIALFALLGISFMAISFFSKKREPSDGQNP